MPVVGMEVSVGKRDEINRRLEGLENLFSRQVGVMNAEHTAVVIEPSVQNMGHRLDDGYVELQVSFSDAWVMPIFIGVCRVEGVRPYRHPKQPNLSVTVRVMPDTFDRQVMQRFNDLYREMDLFIRETVSYLVEDVMGSQLDCEPADRTSASQKPPETIH